MFTATALVTFETRNARGRMERRVRQFPLIHNTPTVKLSTLRSQVRNYLVQSGLSKVTYQVDLFAQGQLVDSLRPSR